MDLVENMFYVSNEANNRFVPWHGLGIPVVEAPTSNDALIMAGLNWDVIKTDVYVNSKAVPGYKANVRSSDGAVLGVVSDRYTIVQNRDAFEFTDNLISDEVHYETAGSLDGGKRVWLLAKMPEQKILDDSIDPYICFTNNHNGTGAIKVCMTPIRVVCNNTLNLALSTATRSWSARHLGNVSQKLEEAKLTLNLANDYMIELNKEAERLATIKITDAEFEKAFDALYPITNQDSKRRADNIIDMKEQLFKCYQMPDVSNYKGTVWGAMMAVTDYADHATPQRVTNNYNEKRWGSIINGHGFVDNMYARLAA